MPASQNEAHPSADDLVGMAADLMKGIAAEPVPQHLVDMAQQLQVALDRQAREGNEAKDLPETG